MQLLNYAKLKWDLFKARFFGEENGAVDLVVIIILIAVAVVLILVFKDKLKELIDKLFIDIEDNAGSASKKYTE